MTNRAVAVVDGRIFDELIEFKSIMEQFDESLKNIQFVHKDKLTEAKASGDFISAPLAFILTLIEDEAEYKKMQEESKRIKKEYDIPNCVMIFPASANCALAKEIKDTEHMDYELFELVRAIHIIHEDYSPSEDVPIKMLALISGLMQCDDEENIAFKDDYVTARISCNYENLNASLILIFESLCKEVDKINGKISELNAETDYLKTQKSKKYQCQFSSDIEAIEVPDFSSIPTRISDLLDFCKRYSSSASQVFEAFTVCADSDVLVAQHALSKTYDRLEEKEVVDPNVLVVSDFAIGEPPTESIYLIKRCVSVKAPSRHKLNEIIPLLKTLKNSDMASLKNVWKMVLFLVLFAVFAMCTYVVPHAIRFGTGMFTNSIIMFIAGFAGVLFLAILTAICFELFERSRFRRYLKNIVDENKQFFSQASLSRAEIREYIDSFITVSVNSFVKTKKIDIAKAKINELKKQKTEYMKKAESIRRKEQVFDAFCEVDFCDAEKFCNIDALKDFILSNTGTEDISNVSCPRVCNSKWIKSIAFEIVIK